MKKRTWLLLLALALLLMAGCSSEKTMGGTITEYLRGDTEVNAFLMEQDGKTIGVRLTGETGIYPALVDITDEALRNAEYPHMEVTVTGEKAEEKLTAADGTEVPTYTASVIIINSIPYGEPLTLEDGTTVQVRLNREGLAYYAPDGMMLLQIYNQIPDDIFVDRVDFDVFPKEAQQRSSTTMRNWASSTIPRTRWSAPGPNTMNWAAPRISVPMWRASPPPPAITMTA